MADPIRLLFQWPAFRGHRSFPTVTAGQILRQDPLHEASRLIQYHELAVSITAP